MSILQKWQGVLPAMDFQKILFLFTQKQQKPSFEFVPYLYGGFSFQSYADKRTMTKYKMILSEENKWIANDENDYISLLDNEDKNNLDSLHSEIKGLRGKKLVRYTYKKYPYYAIKSHMLNILSEEEKLEVMKQKSYSDSFELFTIGYEGKSIEAYLNLLIKNNIHVLCDVRKNPISMKYGFSKKQLEDTTKKVDITYIHIPQLGIDSEKRRGLETKEDYRKLFEEYERETLPKQDVSLESIINLLKKYKRVALTCFEADHEFCHRNKVALAFLNKPNWTYPVKHL